MPILVVNIELPPLLFQSRNGATARRIDDTIWTQEEH